MARGFRQASNRFAKNCCDSPVLSDGKPDTCGRFSKIHGESNPLALLTQAFSAPGLEFSPRSEERQGCRSPRLTRQIHRAPQIPGRRRAMRPPFLAVREQFLRCGQFLQAVSECESFSHAEVG